MELLISLERDGTGVALHEQLEAAVRDGVRDGRLRAGTPLPSSRELARELGVSRGVVVEAYAQLAAEGYLEARPGSGTRVADAARATARDPATVAAYRPPRWDFHPGLPDLSSFPRAEWARSVRRTVAAVPDAALGYGDMRGAAELRAVLAAYLGRARGVVADPDRVVVVSGLVQGIGLVLRALAAEGARRVGLEDPCWHVYKSIVAHAGLEAVPVPVDDDGLRTDALEQAAVDTVIVTPAHQSPLGVVLAPARRAALLEWADRRGALVIEDDYDAEYRYDRDPVGALQGLAPERVVYAGSASKILAPGLRLGWLLPPPGLVDGLVAQKGLADAGTPALDQHALADFIARGELDRHLRRMRARYRSRRDALVHAVDQHLTGARVEGIAAGLHAVVRLPGGTDEAALVRAARQRDVGIHGMAWHAFAPQPPSLVVGYANLPEPSIERGIREVAAAARALA